MNPNTKIENIFKIGDNVFIKNQEWVIADIVGKEVVLYRDSVDGHSRTQKYSLDKLLEKNKCF